jgi:hypothetical protein
MMVGAMSICHQIANDSRAFFSIEPSVRPSLTVTFPDSNAVTHDSWRIYIYMEKLINNLFIFIA